MKEFKVLITPDQFTSAYTALFMPDVDDVKQPKPQPKPRKKRK